MSGYARAHRGRWDHPLFKNKQEAAVWAWMTDTARFRAHAFQTRFGMVHLERGQVLVSERGIADDFGLHKNTVRRLLSTMIDQGMISVNRDHGASRAGTIITITNYERYQGDRRTADCISDQDGTINRTDTGPRQDQDGTTREERGKREEREDRLSPTGRGGVAVAQPQSGVLQFPPVTAQHDAVASAFAAYDATRREIVRGARPLDLTPDRRKKLAARLNEIGGPPEWDCVIAIIRGSPFLRGETSRSGRLVATIDWLLEPNNLRKVREGNYDERSAGHPTEQSAFRHSPIDALSIARAASGLG